MTLRQLDEPLRPSEVAEWVDRCADYLYEQRDAPWYRGDFTYLNVRNLIYNALKGPHIDAGQVRFAVGRSKRFVRRGRTAITRMTLYRVVGT